MVADLVRNLSAKMQIYRPEELKDIEVPNPSGKVFEVTGAYSVSEATALKSAGNTKLLLEKQKGQVTRGMILLLPLLWIERRNEVVSSRLSGQVPVIRNWFLSGGKGYWKKPI